MLLCSRILPRDGELKKVQDHKNKRNDDPIDTFFS